MSYLLAKPKTPQLKVPHECKSKTKKSTKYQEIEYGSIWSIK
jgi:hypothetical protein